MEAGVQSVQLPTQNLSLFFKSSLVQKYIATVKPHNMKLSLVGCRIVKNPSIVENLD